MTTINTTIATSNAAAGLTTASDGIGLPLDSLAHVYGYTTGALTSDTVIYNGNTYIQTYTYTGAALTGTGLYVKQ